MKKFLVFLSEANKRIRSRSDDYVADYHNSIFHLLRISFGSILVCFCIIGCFFMVTLVLTQKIQSGPWIWPAAMAALFSPLVITRKIHDLDHAMWFLTQKWCSFLPPLKRFRLGGHFLFLIPNLKNTLLSPQIRYTIPRSFISSISFVDNLIGTDWNDSPDRNWPVKLRAFCI